MYFSGAGRKKIMMVAMILNEMKVSKVVYKHAIKNQCHFYYWVAVAVVVCSDNSDIHLFLEKEENSEKKVFGVKIMFF